MIFMHAPVNMCEGVVPMSIHDMCVSMLICMDICTRQIPPGMSPVFLRQMKPMEMLDFFGWENAPLLLVLIWEASLGPFRSPGLWY